jgi:rod shape-determining protein MreC
MNFFKSRFFIFVLAMALIAFFTMALSAARKGEVNPVENAAGIIVTSLQKVVTHGRNNISSGMSYFIDFKKLARENQELKDERAALKEKLREYDKCKDENERLKGLLELKETRKDFTFVEAEIISRDVNNWANIFVIDKGKLDGIAAYCPVITNDGLVGTIIDVGTTWAKVSTIVEPTTSMGAMITRSRDVGIVEGSFDLMEQGLCKMSYLSKTTNVVVGDYVETSGLGGLFPKGIMIGTVTEVGLEPHGISKYAILKPEVEFESIHGVFVITSFDEKQVEQP